MLTAEPGSADVIYRAIYRYKLKQRVADTAVSGELRVKLERLPQPLHAVHPEHNGSGGGVMRAIDKPFSAPHPQHPHELAYGSAPYPQHPHDGRAAYEPTGPLTAPMYGRHDAADRPTRPCRPTRLVRE